MLRTVLTTKGMNWDGEGFVLLTAVTITDVSPSLIKKGGNVNDKGLILLAQSRFVKAKALGGWLILKLLYFFEDNQR